MDVGVLQIERIRNGLRTERVGRRIEYLDSTTSTNDEAWARIDERNADGLVVLAEYQTAGRGRLGRAWHSPRGASLLCSVLLIEESVNSSAVDCSRGLKPAAQQSGSRGLPVGQDGLSPDGEPTAQDENEENVTVPLAAGTLVLVAGVAAFDAIWGATQVTPEIRWPNDLKIRGRKVGGILIESRTLADGRPAYVVGIGVNCLQQEGHLQAWVGPPATSLEIETPRPVDRAAVALFLLQELDRWLAQRARWGAEELRSAWLARAEPRGKRIRLQHAGRVYHGTMVDLEPDAALIVQLDEGGTRAFDAATTTVLPEVQANLPGPVR